MTMMTMMTMITLYYDSLSGWRWWKIAVVFSPIYELKIKMLSALFVTMTRSKKV